VSAQELVDDTLHYLLDDLNTLMACSLTCKYFFGATRPLIHRRLVCSGSSTVHPRPSLFARPKRDPGAFRRLVDADRSGVLRYTRHLTIKADGSSLNHIPTFNILVGTSGHIRIACFGAASTPFTAP